MHSAKEEAGPSSAASLLTHLLVQSLPFESLPLGPLSCRDGRKLFLSFFFFFRLKNRKLTHMDKKCIKPKGMCDSAWETMLPFINELSNGGGNFYDGWMQNPYSAMISCNDGFRPVSFYIEVVE